MSRSELKAKIAELAACIDGSVGEPTAEDILQILENGDDIFVPKKVLKEWQEYDKLFIANGTEELTTFEGTAAMTGQEWYDRFHKEVEKLKVSGPPFHDEHAKVQYEAIEYLFLEAGQKAMGIE